MTHTLEALQSGELKGANRLKLACGLNTFPDEIFTLADSLEILDLSDNNLSELPENMSDLSKLKIVFFARNQFTEFPSQLANCPSLSMIGFRSNKITHIPENVFPKKLQWLILTDNKIEQLPKSIGDCHLLQKFGLAGNLLKELPAEMSNCKSLELLRIPTNQLTTIPQWLFELPRLSWVAFNGNPITHRPEIENNLASYDWADFELTQTLGEGASGIISKAYWTTTNKEVAVKVFKGAMTTDGLPEDEMKVSIAAGLHDNLIPVIGKIKNHPNDQNGLVMELISSEYTNLGNPPNFDTCTRDTFNKETSFTKNDLISIAKGKASVCAQLHQRGINHGDLYAHNTLINPKGHSILGDFGAATFYNTNSKLAPFIERVEVRAWACLVEDVLNLIPLNEFASTKRSAWENLIASCMNTTVHERPSFAEILEKLNQM